jgi:Bacterial archaeo-eukaryotic release factor family 10
MITAETVNSIVRFQANGLPVVSVYCRVDPGASRREVCARVDSLLDQIRPLAKDRDLDHRYRLSVRTDIERIKDALDSERWPPGTIAIFSCSGRGLYEEIPLPRRVREQVMVDKTPLARPMLAVLGEYPRACVLVVNREAAPVWEMYQDEMREVETVTGPLRKAGNAGTRSGPARPRPDADRTPGRRHDHARRRPADHRGLPPGPAMAAAVAGPVRASTARAGHPGRDRPGRRGPRRPGRTALPGRDRGSGRP